MHFNFENIYSNLGTYKDGVKNGIGIYFFADGRKLKAKWEDDKLIPSFVKIYWEDGKKYHGIIL